MDVQASDVGTLEIDHVLEQGATAFDLPTEIEGLYRADRIAGQRRAVAINMAVLVFLFDSFVVNDYFMLRDSLYVYLVGKFLVVTPVCLLCALTALWSDRHYEPACWLFSVTMTATLSVMLYCSSGAYRANYLFGDLLIMVGTIAMIGPRLRWALSAILAQSACFAFVVTMTDIVSRDSWAVSLLFCVSAGIIAAFTAYALEASTRRAFLFKLRTQILNRDLVRMATVDPLTGLGNRRALGDATRRHWADGAASRRWASMILIDIDFFKSFNDAYGHPAGDLCLERIARCVSGEMRPRGDLAVRFGGEEILVFLPDTELAEASVLAEVIRQAILAVAIPHAEGSSAAVVTASLGVASALVADCTATELVKHADVALYAAKKNGRNRVCASPPGAAIVPHRSGAGMRDLAA